ncbi:MAG: thymidylate synthase [Candidatus Nanoarchaeia archaeon]|nr:thymidylate synthase [Candidatus Nanoarchaeia archaeon]
MKTYLDIVKNIIDNGVLKKNRTGVDTIAVAGVMFEHDMKEGFPLLTTKSVPLKLVASELEFFIKGITDKKWLQERNNHIWDEWCTQKKVPYNHDEETKKKMSEERDLGPIYGWQWRNFGAKYDSFDKDPIGNGIDQLKNLVETLKKNPNDRRMIVNAWNPVDLKDMALPPCHYCFQVTVINGKLNLLWNQRSVDVALGLPFNIASYGLLLHLLAKETGLNEGRLVGFLGDTHIYVNHLDGLKEQIERKPFNLPKIKTEKFTSIFEWKYDDSIVDDYNHHPRIKFKVAV